MLSQAVNTTILCLHAFFTLWTARKLFLFLSWEQEQQEVRECNVDAETENLLFDLSLIAGFCLHHSATKPSLLIGDSSPQWAKTYYKLLYAAGTNASLVALVDNWRAVCVGCLWSTPATWHSVLWPLHLYAWLVVLVSFVVMDLPALMGVRPVYQKVFLRLEAEAKSDFGLDCLYKSHRHGSFLAFLVIAFARSQMGLDRALLAAALAGYMYFRFRPTRKELEYQNEMWRIKKAEMREYDRQSTIT